MRTFKVLLHKEFLQIRRNPFLPRLIVLFPIVVMLVMPLIMTMDVRNIHVAVVDLDGSALSQRIISDIGASRYFTLAGISSDYQQAIDELENGQADVIVQIPDHFERDMTLSSPRPVSITANAVNATKGSMGMQYLVQAISHTLAGVRAEKSPAQITDLITVQNRYNPTLNYRHYMIPALMIILFIMLCGFLPALSIVGEKESGTIEQINVTPVSHFTFILAKLLPYWIIGLFVLAVAVCVAWLAYGLVPVGNFGVIMLGTALFILTISGLSLTVANFSDTMQQAMFVMFFINMVFMLMSGLLTPIDSMPAWAQNLTLILPPRYFVEILRASYLKGTALMELSLDFIVLSVSAVLFNLLAALTYKKQA